MSWSVSLIGLPDKINTKLDEYSATLSGASKEEFDKAKPSLQALISQNHGQAPNGMVKLEANGHAGTSYSNCNVSISGFYANLAL